MKKLIQITRIPKSEFLESIRLLDERKWNDLPPPDLPLYSLSKYVSESFAADPTEPVPDCCTCGICCVFALIVPVAQDGSDPAGEYWDITADDSPVEVVIERVVPRDYETGWCKHLTGTLKKEIGCAIYDRRPQVCRDFEAGSDRCHAYRRLYGLETALSETEIARIRETIESRAAAVRITAVDIEVRSVEHRSGISAEGFWERTDVTMGILVEAGNSGSRELFHEYRASDETWFESELLGLTIDEALKAVEKRSITSGNTSDVEESSNSRIAGQGEDDK